MDGCETFGLCDRVVRNTQLRGAFQIEFSITRTHSFMHSLSSSRDDTAARARAKLTTTPVHHGNLFIHGERIADSGACLFVKLNDRLLDWNYDCEFREFCGWMCLARDVTIE